jgi:cysteine-S-conjugate beta-lyase
LIRAGANGEPGRGYNARKGLRSAAARLAMHTAHAAEVVAWLAETAAAGQAHSLSPLPEYIRATPCGGATSRVPTASWPSNLPRILPPRPPTAFIDSLRLFGIGASWGGYESLALTYPVIHGWHGGALHIGLEDPADLIADLAQGFRAALA